MNTKTAVILFALFIVIIGGVLCIAIIGSSDRSDNSDKKPISDVLNDSEGVTLEIKKETVSDKGLTIIIINKSQKDYTYGDAYYVEKEINGSWYLIPPVSGDGFAWHAIAYTLNKNSTAEQELYWERTYGNLDAGNYRINKEILYIRAPGDFDKFNVYAEFVID